MQTKFDIIWGRFHNKLEWLVKSKISNNEDAQDVLQNIFVKIYKNIDRLDDIEKLSSWINKVAKNTIIDYYKKVEVTKVNIDDMQLEDNITIDESFNSEISKCLSTFINQLSETDKTIIQKAHFNKIKHRKIAQEFNITEANSKVKFSRAKKRLKKLLSNCCEFEADKYGNIISCTQKSNYDCDC